MQAGVMRYGSLDIEGFIARKRKQHQDYILEQTFKRHERLVRSIARFRSNGRSNDDYEQCTWQTITIKVRSGDYPPINDLEATKRWIRRVADNEGRAKSRSEQQYEARYESLGWNDVGTDGESRWVVMELEEDDL